MVDLIELLHSHHQLAMFSFMDFHCCSSAVIVLLLDSILHPTGESFRRIKIAMLCLQHIAEGCAVAKKGMRLIEEFQGLVERVTGRLRPIDPITHMEVEKSTRSGQLNDLSGTMSALKTGSYSLQPELITSHEHQSSSIVGIEMRAQGSPTVNSPDINAEPPSTLIDYEYLGSGFSLDFLTSVEQ